MMLRQRREADWSREMVKPQSSSRPSTMIVIGHDEGNMVVANMLSQMYTIQVRRENLLLLQARDGP